MTENPGSNKPGVFISILRIFLGALFILSSVTKMMNPGHFAAVVLEYRMIPLQLIPIFAVVFPWIQLLCGAMLIINIYTKSNALILGVLLLMMTSAVSFNLLRGVIHDCGCFEIFNISEKIGAFTIIRNIVLIGMVSAVFLRSTNVLVRVKEA